MKFLSVNDDNANQNPDFSGHTVLLSVPSLGNVGQLACDLMITTFGATRIGYLDTDNLVLPVVGNDPYFYQEQNTTSTKKKKGKNKKSPNNSQPPFGEVHCGVEVFEIKEQQIILIHVRAPITQPQQFSKQILEWVSDDCSCERMVVLGSGNASWQMDDMIQEQQPVLIRSVSIGWKESLMNQGIPELNTQKDKFVRGVAKWLLKEVENRNYTKTKALQFSYVFMICSEGENLNHGLNLAYAISVFALHLIPKEQEMKDVKWVIPSSWTLLYGGYIRNYDSLYF